VQRSCSWQLMRLHTSALVQRRNHNRAACIKCEAQRRGRRTCCCIQSKLRSVLHVNCCCVGFVLLDEPAEDCVRMCWVQHVAHQASSTYNSLVSRSLKTQAILCHQVQQIPSIPCKLQAAPTHPQGRCYRRTPTGYCACCCMELNAAALSSTAHTRTWRHPRDPDPTTPAR
jgi:hypothetical protein